MIQNNLITYKCRLLLRTSQKTKALHYIDGCRGLYNKLKCTTDAALFQYGVVFTKKDRQDLLPSFRKQFPWIKAIHSQVCQDVNIRLQKAYDDFFRGKGNGHWAKKGKYNSFTFPQRCIMKKHGVVNVPDFGNIKFKDTYGIPLDTEIRQCKISYDYLTKNFFVSITCLYDKEVLSSRRGIMNDITAKVGIDMGVAKAVTCSDGMIFENPQVLLQSDEKMKRLQRKLSGQRKYCKRWKRTKRKIALLSRKVANQRYDFQQKVTTEIIRKNQAIAVEDLKVKKMTATAKGSIAKPGKNVKQKAKLNRSILDVGFSQFIEILKYKSLLYGRTFVAVNPAYTSQTCSACGCCDKKSRISQSLFVCTNCGYTENADINAAKNIRGRAFVSQ